MTRNGQGSLPVRLTCSATTAWSPTKETAATNGSHVQHQVANAAGASAESYRPGHDNPAWFLSELRGIGTSTGPVRSVFIASAKQGSDTREFRRRIADSGTCTHGFGTVAADRLLGALGVKGQGGPRPRASH